jgi:hypothetical protein
MKSTRLKAIYSGGNGCTIRKRPVIMSCLRSMRSRVTHTVIMNGLSTTSASGNIHANIVNRGNSNRLNASTAVQPAKPAKGAHEQAKNYLGVRCQGPGTGDHAIYRVKSSTFRRYNVGEIGISKGPIVVHVHRDVILWERPTQRTIQIAFILKISNCVSTRI